MSFYLGRYNCVDRIGQGPLGETWRAKIYGVAGFEKQFAVKKLHPQLCADGKFVERFVRAARRAAELRHERIAAVHECGAEGAQYYVVADLMLGMDLAQLLERVAARNEAIPTDAAIFVVLDIVEALAYAHSRVDLQPAGVVHLGLTPRAIMVTPEGDGRLLDVGMLAAIAQPGWSERADLVSSLPYFAPEVAACGVVDGRADVFSLGAILHEIVSGGRAFPGKSAAELRAQMMRPPSPPACDGRLQQLLQSALAHDPGARPPSVDAFGDVLRALIGPRGARARGDLATLVKRHAPRPEVQKPLEARLGDPTRNTFAGVGPADYVPYKDVVLPGPPTEKHMTIDVEAYAPTAAMPIIPLPTEERPTVVPEETPPVEPAPPPVEEPAVAEPPAAQPFPAAHPPTTTVKPLPLPGSRRGTILAVAGGLLAALFGGAWLWAVRTAPPPPAPVEPPKPIAAPSPSAEPVAASPKSILGAKPPQKNSLTVEVKPLAAIFVDGEQQSKFPLELSAGKHKVVALAEGSKLRKEEVEVKGPTRLEWALEPAPPSSGPAGLKLRCKSVGELRIFVDGADTGMACPNDDRINLAPGSHKVELYAPKGDKTIEVPIQVAEGKNASTRVRVNY